YNMETGRADFIIIEDNKVDCFIAEKTIQNSGKGNSCITFSHAALALDYIEKHESEGQVIIFVDLQIPPLNGFEFVESVVRLPLSNRHLYRIYTFASSINERDRERIKMIHSVRGFLNKPLTVAIINQVFQVNSP